ncbi:MAG: hypothetical protein JOZ17_01580 [Acetobacteraceae bacterium]|nr:hypothetical protein [Acetobacteraceae bacterium]
MAAPSTRVVAATCVAEILGLAGFSIVPALLPQFIETWSLTNTQAGWLAGIVSAGYTLVVIPLVSLTDRTPSPRNAHRVQSHCRGDLIGGGRRNSVGRAGLLGLRLVICQGGRRQ